MLLPRRANRALFGPGIYRAATGMLGQPFFDRLAFLEASQFWSAEQLQAYQRKKWEDTVEYARKNVPHYKRSLAQVDGRSAFPVDLPTISKEDIRDRPGDFESDGHFRISTKTTGGSTGQPVTLKKSAEAMGWEQAGTWRAYRWAHLDVGDRQMRFWGVPLGGAGRIRNRIRDFLLNRRRCSAFAFDEEDLARYLRQMQRFKPAYLYGYVSMLEEFARYVAKNAKTKFDGLQCVISTSEVLGKPQRDVIEAAFGCRVYNEYGCGELGSIAHECEHGKLHVTAENVLVETLVGDRNCQPGEPGELVITELNNRAMPLIRYRIGDFGSLGSDTCECGRHLPVLNNLHGRAYDTISNSAGKKFHGEFFLYILENCRKRGLDIRAMQVVQDSVTSLRVRMVVESGFGDVCEYFRRELEDKFDRSFSYEFERVSAIGREASGKMRLIVGLPAN